MYIQGEVMNVQHTDDTALVARAAKGDAAAFESLMELHEGRIYAIALRMCGNREDALDCAQEAMLRIYHALDRFKGQSSFATWVYRITMNSCLDELRKRKVRAAASLDAMLESGWSPAAGDEGLPEAQALRGEQRDIIRAAIGSLPEDMRAVIVLRDIQGFSYEQIADMLEANIGTIKSRISRGREKLREILISR